MKVTVQLPEDVVESLGGTEAAGQALLQRLHALPQYRLGDRIVVLDTEARSKLETLLNTPLGGPLDVVNAVQRLAAVGIGEVIRPLTPGESERVKVYASSHGITTADALRQFVDPILAQWLGDV